MSTKIVNLSLPEELLKRVDAAAKKEYSSRSDYMRLALLAKLQALPSNNKSIDAEYEQFKAIYGKTLKNLAKK